MKYENIVMFTFIGIIVLLLTVITIQAYELKNIENERNFYFENFYRLLNYNSSNTESFIIQKYSDELTISKDGLRIEHNLKPQIEMIR